MELLNCRHMFPVLDKTHPKRNIYVMVSVWAYLWAILHYLVNDVHVCLNCQGKTLDSNFKKDIRVSQMIV